MIDYAWIKWKETKKTQTGITREIVKNARLFHVKEIKIKGNFLIIRCMRNDVLFGNNGGKNEKSVGIRFVTRNGNWEVQVQEEDVFHDIRIRTSDVLEFIY